MLNQAIAGTLEESFLLATSMAEARRVAEAPLDTERFLFMLNDMNAEVRMRTAQSLGWMGDKNAAKPLAEKTLFDNVSSVRCAAAYALGRIGDAQAVIPLAVAMENDPVPDVKGAAAWAMGTFKDAASILIDAMQNDRRETVCIAAARVLCKSHDLRATSAMVEVLNTHHFNKVREVAAASLSFSIGNGQARQSLIDALSDEAENVRAAADKSLEFIFFFDANCQQVHHGLKKGATDDIEKWSGEIMHSNTTIATNAARSMGGVATHQKDAVVPLLIDALQHADPNVRRAASWSLGKLDSHDAMEPLMAMLRDEDWHVRQSARHSLDKIDNTWASGKKAWAELRKQIFNGSNGPSDTEDEDWKNRVAENHKSLSELVIAAKDSDVEENDNIQGLNEDGGDDETGITFIP